MRGDELPPLHGVPISIKDLVMTKGVRTTSGSLAYKDHVPAADSAVAERVKASGAILLGKTNTPEFGSLGANENRLGDDCRNPWNTERTSGASSGGAGASVAAGLCSLGTGSDGGGSIRIPASYCGIYGIKPTQGRVSGFSGVPQDVPLANLLGQNGPMTRTVKDSAILLQALSGYDPRDASSLHAPVPDFVAAVDRDIGGLRMGWSADLRLCGRRCGGSRSVRRGSASVRRTGLLHRRERPHTRRATRNLVGDFRADFLHYAGPPAGRSFGPADLVRSDAHRGRQGVYRCRLCEGAGS